MNKHKHDVKYGKKTTDADKCLGRLLHTSYHPKLKDASVGNRKYEYEDPIFLDKPMTGKDLLLSLRRIHSPPSMESLRERGRRCGLNMYS